MGAVAAVEPPFDRSGTPNSPCTLHVNMPQPATQVPCNLREGGRETYEEIGTPRVWLAGTKADDGKRFCTLQIIARGGNGNPDLPRHGQPKIGIIFRGQGIRLSDEEMKGWHPEVHVRFQPKVFTPCLNRLATYNPVYSFIGLGRCGILRGARLQGDSRDHRGGSQEGRGKRGVLRQPARADDRRARDDRSSESSLCPTLTSFRCRPRSVLTHSLNALALIH